MKRISLIVLAFGLFFCSFAQTIEGTWTGVLKVQGMELPIVFHISQQEGEWITTMDSPKQNATNIPTTSTTFTFPFLNIAIDRLMAKYEGSFDGKHGIKGTFTQRGVAFEMDLSREPYKAPIVNRPQTPLPPFTYKEEEVVFKNKEAGIDLAGTLSIPAGKGKFPVVVLISGSGPQDRNEEIFDHKPFWVIADDFAKKGIAVLRFDDRGVGKSQGEFEKATSLDFASDVEAAVSFLKKRKEINSKQIGLIGHSEGGIIAPIVAVNCSDVSFIVLLAGTGVNGKHVMLKQTEDVYLLSGVSSEEVSETIRLNTLLFDLFLNTSPDSLNTAALKQAISDIIEQSNPQLMSMQDKKAMIDQTLASLNTSWMRYFMTHEPAPVLEKVKVPVLALIGSKDCQVNPKINLPAIESALKAGGNTQFVVKELPNLNHLFQNCESGSPAEYAEIEETFSVAALNEVSQWIKSLVRDASK